MKFTIYTEPIPKARARTVVRNGRVMSFTPKATAEAEATIRAQIADSKTFYQKDTPLMLSVTFHVSRPPSVPKKRILPITRPDIDNYIKTVMDAINGYLMADDSQVCLLVAGKKYGAPPRIEFEIEALE